MQKKLYQLAKNLLGTVVEVAVCMRVSPDEQQELSRPPHVWDRGSSLHHAGLLDGVAPFPSDPNVH